MKTIEKLIRTVLLIILFGLIVGFIENVNKIQGNARAINYAGSIRGSSQRLVKLVMSGEESDGLVLYIDDIFSGLLSGGGAYQLTRIDDADYLNKLQNQYDYWQLFKKEIYKARERGYENTQVILMSENFYYMADDTVQSAEQYSNFCENKLNGLKMYLVVDMALIVIFLLKETVETIMLSKKNKELRHLAYLDLHTGLPNKGRCEQMLNCKEMDESTAVLIFDLNGLKAVNDKKGHLVGDQFISDFAYLLRQAIPEQHFVGRYGGDEFIAILSSTNHEQVKGIIDCLRKNTDYYNTLNQQFQIDYACGYALSTDLSQPTYRTLLEKADQYMYKNKSEMKLRK